MSDESGYVYFCVNPLTHKNEYYRKWNRIKEKISEKECKLHIKDCLGNIRYHGTLSFDELTKEDKLNHQFVVSKYSDSDDEYFYYLCPLETTDMTLISVEEKIKSKLPEVWID